MKYKFSNRNVKIMIVLLLLVLSFAAAIMKIFTGLDMDEEYNIVLGYRLYNGEHMFSDMWEIHQTSSLFVYPFIWIWQNLHGNPEYIILFLRIICTVLHLGLAILLYRTLLKCSDRFYSFCLACIFFNFLPKWILNLEFEYLLVFWLALTSVFLYKTSANAGDSVSITKCRVFASIAGFCFSMAVLSYPTVLIVCPIYLLTVLFLFKNLGGDRHNIVILYFVIACLVSAIIFCIFVFRNISVREFMHTLPYLLADGSHTYHGKILGFMKELPILLIRAGVPGIAAWTGSYLIEKYSNATGKGVFLYRWVCLWNISFVFIILVCNLLGRRSGPVGLQTRHLVLFFSGLCFIGYLQETIKEKALLLWMTGLFAYLSVILATNLSLEISASALILGMLGALMALCSWNKVNSKEVKILKSFTLIVLTLGIIFNKGFFVRVDGTGPASILEERVQAQMGPLRGIWIYESDYTNYKRKAKAIEMNTNVDDTMLYLSHSLLGNFFSKGRFTSVTSHGTAVYDEQWAAYYEEFKHQPPSVIVIDSDIINNLYVFLEESPFGRWIAKNYKIENVFFTEGLWFIRKK